jgi:hypothetical protein
MAGCGTTTEGDAFGETESFVFRATGLRDRPGMFTEDMAADMARLLGPARGVKAVDVVIHPESKLDNRITVDFDPAMTSPVAIAQKVRGEWEIVWFKCDRCGETGPDREICCGMRMEEFH